MGVDSGYGAPKPKRTKLSRPPKGGVMKGDKGFAPGPNKPVGPMKPVGKPGTSRRPGPFQPKPKPKPGLRTIQQVNPRMEWATKNNSR